MTSNYSITLEKVNFLSDVALKELKHLRYSQSQVFIEPFTVERASNLAENEAFAAHLEAFASRFCRFQDMLGDKLFPAWLELVGEKQKTFLDNLNRLEKLDIIHSAEHWLQARSLRNKMIHEYISSNELMVDAVNQANDYIDELNYSLNQLLHDMEGRR